MRTITGSNYQWLSREEWATRQRTCYYDLFEDLPYPRNLDAYASPEEITAAIAILEQEWKTEGIKLRQANRTVGPLAQQSGETPSEHLKRYLAMSEQEQKLCGIASDHRWRRKEIREAIKELQSNTVPRNFQHEAISVIQTRLEAARLAAEEKRTAEILATPIDDAAWEEELRWRAWIENGERGV
jgi:hypothetical protein